MLKLGIVKCTVNTKLSYSYTFPFQGKGKKGRSRLEETESKGGRTGGQEEWKKREIELFKSGNEESGS